MIHRTVGFMRNLIKKRKEIKNVVYNYIMADEVLLITLGNYNLNVVGNVSDTPTSLFMLGRTLGASYQSALKEDPGLTLEDYVNQPAKVAIAYINKQQASQ